MFFKTIIEGYIILISNEHGDIPISEGEYYEVKMIIDNRPNAPTGYRYRLNANTLEWELCELPKDGDLNVE